MNKYFELFENAILQFSGGKDSVVALHMCIPWKDKITVQYCDTGDSFPHVIAYIRSICEEWGFKLEIIEPPVKADEYVELFGIPSDILPIWSSQELRSFVPKNKKDLIQSASMCCNNLLWMPLHMAAFNSGCKLVIRGTKGSDEHVSIAKEFLDENTEITFVSPVWDMTDEGIYEYIKDNDIRLPFHYRVGINHSLDCMKCSAWGTTKAECQRVELTKKYYPEAMPELKRRSTVIYNTVTESLREITEFHSGIQNS